MVAAKGCARLSRRLLRIDGEVLPPVFTARVAEKAEVARRRMIQTRTALGRTQFDLEAERKPRRQTSRRGFFEHETNANRIVITPVCRSSRRTSSRAARVSGSSCKVAEQENVRSLRKTWRRLATGRDRKDIPQKRLLEPVVWRRSSNRTSRRLDSGFRISGRRRSEFERRPTLERAVRQSLRPSSARSPFPARDPYLVPPRRPLA